MLMLFYDISIFKHRRRHRSDRVGRQKSALAFVLTFPSSSSALAFVLTSSFGHEHGHSQQPGALETTSSALSAAARRRAAGTPHAITPAFAATAAGRDRLRGLRSLSSFRFQRTAWQLSSVRSARPAVAVAAAELAGRRGPLLASITRRAAECGASVTPRCAAAATAAHSRSARARARALSTRVQRVQRARALSTRRARSNFQKNAPGR